MHLNIVIRQDANLPLLVNEFANEFVGYYIASLVNLYSGYNQMLLYLKSRDLIVFFTLFRLLQNTTLL
jgi:hypothetical protein